MHRLEVLHHEVLRGALRQRMIPAIALAREREGTKRHQPGMADHHARGPRMTHDKSLAMIERLGVFWMQPGALLERTLHDHRPIPGHFVQRVPGFGTVLGVWRGEALQRRDCAIAMGVHHLRQLGCVQSGKPGGFLERMVPGHDHQKQEVTRADGLKTSTDHDRTGDPSLPSLRSPVASPVSRWRWGERRIRER